MGKKINKYPSQSYLAMGVGACLIAGRFIGDAEQWSNADYLKVGVGVAMLGFGIFKLIRKK